MDGPPRGYGGAREVAQLWKELAAVSLVDERSSLSTGRQGRRERKRLRRLLRDQDRLNAKLAELYCVDALLARASRFVEQGWIQHGWFTYVDPSGVRRIVTGCSPRITRTVSPDQVVATCLVGGIVNAAGGPQEARSQLVQRSTELAWHALFRGVHEPIRWCRSPAERAGHVMDLVRWNDSPGRTPSEVAALLGRARALARAEGERTRCRQVVG